MVSIEVCEVNPNDDPALKKNPSESMRESQLLLAFPSHYQGYEKKLSVILKPVDNVLKKIIYLKRNHQDEKDSRKDFLN